MEIIGNSLEEVWIEAAKRVIADGEKRAPRGLPTREVVGMQLVLKSPRTRIPRLPVREFSLAYGMGELAWYAAADDSLEFIKHYAPSYGKYSDDGKRLHGAYGPRIFGVEHWVGSSRSHHPSDVLGWAEHLEHCFPAQWDRCIAMLLADPDSRQAVIPIFRPSDTGYVTKDMPCTLSLQFLIRNSQLNMVVNMRSNDLWFGGVYDLFCFTALQELMANALQLPVGIYYHHVGSFHLYERNLVDIVRCVEASDNEILKSPLPAAIKQHETIPDLLQLERSIRLGSAVQSLEKLCVLLEDWPAMPSLWQLGTAAWRWKKINGASEIKEEQRRYVRGLLQDRVGTIMFDRCFC